MILSKEDELAKASGPIIFSKGISKFLSLFNIPQEYGESYGLLILSAFLITTLDTATRISRYILQEFFNWDIKKTRIIATLLTLILPLIITFTNIKDAQGNPIPAYKSIWPIFGTTNQLLAALALLAITLWLAKIKKNYFFVLLPMIFMLVVTLTSLFNIMLIYKFTLIGIIDIILFILAIYLVFLTFKKLYIK
ncbi:MAG TPA: carbon starvation CstA 5TM domain-containing protein [bacterium]|nr:carbon starvation CstA 5TM domain-containing protein [bacterium]HOL48693.1 carbon starvation CstA 5TM domain-containing protein [bacterium]